MSDRWDRVGALFQGALALSGADRQAFVLSSAEPQDIQNEVLSLLAAHTDAGDFLEPPAATAPDQAILTDGVLVGPYRIERVLGRGGMGVVYLADDTRLHRRVALKSLSPSISREPHHRARLEQEARAAAALSHPGIATVYALEELGDQLFIVSEYLEGETLRAEMERGPAAAETATATALEIARTLCVAHQRGIVHRDLKPENIVRTTSGVLKILDFGVAQFSDAARNLLSRTRLTEPGMMVGTPPYMSPEQLLGRNTDFRSDHFAFGVLLYELCTGRHPFGGHSLPSTIAQILATEPPPPRPDDGMSVALWRIIDRCLQKDPTHRFATTRDLVTALEGLAVAPRTPPSALRTLHPAPALRTPPASARVDNSRELRRGRARAASGGVGGHPALRTPLHWWRFHQFAAALAYWSMVWPVWHVHRSFGRAGLFVFLATLAAVVVAGTLRLHLWFSSRVHPETLSAQRHDTAQWIRWADVAFAALLIIGGIALPGDRAGWTALFISFGIGSAVAAFFIEPATARAAFDIHRSE